MTRVLAVLLLLTACSSGPDAADKLNDTYTECGDKVTAVLGESTFDEPDDKLVETTATSVSISADTKAAGRFDKWATGVASCLMSTLASPALRAKFEGTTAMSGVQDESEDGLRFVWSFSSPDLSLTIEAD